MKNMSNDELVLTLLGILGLGLLVANLGRVWNWAAAQLHLQLPADLGAHPAKQAAALAAGLLLLSTAGLLARRRRRWNS